MKILKKIDQIASSLSFGASVMILIVMVVVISDVVGRVVFSSPIVGVIEIIKMAIPVIAFFMFPWATHEFRHVRSTILYARMPLWGRTAVDVLSYAAGAAIFLFIVYAEWPEFMTAIRIHEIEGEGAFRIVTWPTRLLIIVSSLLVAYQMIRCAILAIVHPTEDIPTDY